MGRHQRDTNNSRSQMQSSEFDHVFPANTHPGTSGRMQPALGFPLDPFPVLSSIHHPIHPPSTFWRDNAPHTMHYQPPPNFSYGNGATNGPYATHVPMHTYRQVIQRQPLPPLTEAQKISSIAALVDGNINRLFPNLPPNFSTILLSLLMDPDFGLQFDLHQLHHMGDAELVRACVAVLGTLEQKFINGEELPVTSEELMHHVGQLLSTPNSTMPIKMTNRSNVSGLHFAPAAPATPTPAAVTEAPVELRDFLKTQAARNLVREAIQNIDVCNALLTTACKVLDSAQAQQQPRFEVSGGINGFVLTGNLDFGTHQTMPVDWEQIQGVAAHGDSSSSVLDMVLASSTAGTFSPSNEQGSRVKNALMFRQLIFENHGDSDYWVIGGVQSPSLPHTFMAIDDARLFLSDGHSSVYLRPGQICSVTVAFSCADGPHRSAETGVMQQLVVFLIAVKQGSKSYAQLSGVQGLPVANVGDFKVFAVIRKLIAAVVPSSADDLIKSALDVEATPYVSQGLKALLDSAATKVFKIDGTDAAELLPHGLVFDQSMSAARSQTAILEDVQIWTDYTNCLDGITQQFKQFFRMLHLEEVAMEQDIKRHDMFYARLRFAVFQGAADSVASIPYRILTGTKKSAPQDTDATLHMYRGPHIAALQPKGLFKHSPAASRLYALGMIDVPGLPEGRPSVLIGDTVHIRTTHAPDVEIVGIVAATDQTIVFILLPRSFFVEYGVRTNIKKAMLDRDAAGIALAETMIDQITPTGKFEGLVHVRFSFDRRPMMHMRAALVAALQRSAQYASVRENGSCCCLLPSALPLQTASYLQPTQSLVDTLAAKFQEQGKQKLNIEQKKAVVSVLAGAARAAPFTLFGPPGTGKTVTLVELCLQLFHRNEFARILVTAPQNYSADLLCSALRAAGIKRHHMLRVNDPRRQPYTVKDDVMDFSLYNSNTRMFDLPSNRQLLGCRIIVTTCSGAGLLAEPDSVRTGQLVSRIPFNYVLIDEAGQALLPEALIPLSLIALPRSAQVQGGDYGCVMCGDSKQLGPIVRSPLAAKHGLAVSLLESFIEAHTASVVSVYNDDKVPRTVMLLRNYRSNSALLELPSKLFYQGSLLAAADPASVLPPQWNELRTEEEDEDQDEEDGGNDDDSTTANDAPEPPTTASLLFYGVRGEQKREADSPSYFNVHEASVVVELIQGLMQSGTGVVANDIGVMATYRTQVVKLRLMLRQRGLRNVRVGTCDDWQGQEQRIIFISTVLSKPHSLPPASGSVDTKNKLPSHHDSHVAIWRNPKRFNVAITRAKALLVVVGHPAVLAEDPSWRELLRHCVAQGVFRGAGAKLMKERFRIDVGENSPDHLLQYNMPASNAVQGDGDEEEERHEDGDEEMQRAIGQLAELVLLGAGDADRMFPDLEDLEEMYEAYADETAWRIML